MLSYVTDRGGWGLKQVNGGGEHSDYSDYSKEKCEPSSTLECTQQVQVRVWKTERQFGGLAFTINLVAAFNS